ncbi:hypothetical protein [Legionella pneumophila]|uniref:hypothetical protein n=1 Tax=Legionella pneumophila TaxID=446 RepID=UPI00026D9EA6|nr:hypothetical protein [Legionella pneumophila]MDW9141079.1 hypothetical protein [Legionella pneumophila]CCD09707.1 conserved protein of unknown function [Legionella pneumophila subsp. pneumophila]CZI71646.1 Uncharacterised protein [Legionella pneumophila]CZQ88150.1 Uncharacterised protein [Legionella pneumophila]STX66595.1 Uncharacterised protein [Legionella pneumophila]
MDISKRISTNSLVIEEALIKFLTQITDPAFGIHNKSELEYLVFELMKNTGIFNDNTSLYSLMTELGITQTKASQLIYNYDVRKQEDDKILDEKIIEALLNADFAKDGDYFVLDIESPLLRVYLKKRLKEIGHVSDGSFSQTVVRMNLNAVSGMIEYYLPKEEHNKVKDALIKAGAPDGSFKGVLKSSLKYLGSRVLGEGAGTLVDNFSDMVKGLVESSVDIDAWKTQVFNDKKKE